MKTARERAEKYLDSYFCDDHDESDIDTLEIYFEECRKEQDKITRHACAEAVQNYAAKDGYDKNGTLIQTSLAVAECMNVKAV